MITHVFTNSSDVHVCCFRLSVHRECQWSAEFMHEVSIVSTCLCQQVQPQSPHSWFPQCGSRAFLMLRVWQAGEEPQLSARTYLPATPQKDLPPQNRIEIAHGRRKWDNWKSLHKDGSEGKFQYVSHGLNLAFMLVSNLYSVFSYKHKTLLNLIKINWWEEPLLLNNLKEGGEVDTRQVHMTIIHQNILWR
jgi:hypothetical protein